jgi:hypothetical protein
MRPTHKSPAKSKAQSPRKNASATSTEMHIETPAAAKAVEIFSSRTRSEKKPASEGGA